MKTFRFDISQRRSQDFQKRMILNGEVKGRGGDKFQKTPKLQQFRKIKYLRSLKKIYSRKSQRNEVFSGNRGEGFQPSSNHFKRTFNIPQLTEFRIEKIKYENSMTCQKMFPLKTLQKSNVNNSLKIPSKPCKSCATNKMM